MQIVLMANILGCPKIILLKLHKNPCRIGNNIQVKTVT